MKKEIVEQVKAPMQALRNDPEYSEITKAIIIGIKKYLHGRVDEEVFDELVTNAWELFLSFPTEKQTPALAYYRGYKVASMWWEEIKKKRARELDVDTLPIELHPRIDHPSESRKESNPKLDLILDIVGEDDYDFLLCYFSTSQIKPRADSERAERLIRKVHEESLRRVQEHLTSVESGG